jgi:hypothetical protein
MLRRACWTRGNILGGGVSCDPSTSRRLKSVGAPVGMTSRETKVSQSIVPLTYQQCRDAIRLGKNSGRGTASEARPYRRAEKTPGSKSARHNCENTG